MGDKTAGQSENACEPRALSCCAPALQACRRATAVDEPGQLVRARRDRAAKHIFSGRSENFSCHSLGYRSQAQTEVARWASSRCASPVASARSQSRKATILGSIEVALGQSIQ